MAQKPEPPKRILAEDLDDRQIRGMRLKAAADRSSGMVILQNDSMSIWRSKRGNRAWDVQRELRNRRGSLVVEYRCPCGDFQKNGRVDCLHIFAERLRRGEVEIEGEVPRNRMRWANASRRPARTRRGANGRAMRTTQRDARVAIPERLPELISDLIRSMSNCRVDGTKPTTAECRNIHRAAALVFKIALGKSNDEMKSVFKRLIADGILDLKKVPHQNTISRWMNNPALTLILRQMLERTARPFRLVERAAVVDSSKMSQMRSAHARYVDYGEDERENAHWMKLHALVGVETLVCMGIELSGTNSGNGQYPVHDVNYILPLVEKTRSIFDLRFILADKAYLSEKVVGRLKMLGIQAVIPVKKRFDSKNMKVYHDAVKHLVEWFDERQPEFHEIYRLRSKVESYFSLLKSVTSGFCWSRGRPRKDADGRIIDNSLLPCTAWENETLCKVVYVNFRVTVTYEISGNYRMTYASDRFFPPLPEDERLVS